MVCLFRATIAWSSFARFHWTDPPQETHARIVDYFAWRDESRSFEVMGAAMGHNADFGADAGGVPAERIGGQSITADAFAALGVQPLLGRTFTVQDEEESGNAPARVIILSHQLWQHRYFGRPDVIGQQVRLDRINRTVIGVMPETFQYPNAQTNYWIPLRMERSQDRNPQRFFVVTARLKDDVTIEQAQSDLETIGARLARVDPERHDRLGRPRQAGSRGDVRLDAAVDSTPSKAPSPWCCSSRARMWRDCCWREDSSAAPRLRFVRRSAPDVDASFASC